MSLYDILNVPKHSKKDEIEKAYKKIAMKVHPVVSKNGDTEFVELNRAYSILKDDYKRDFYDIFGDNSISLLNRDNESFITVRIFDRFNILCYALFIFGLVYNILLLPISMYYDLIKYSTYIFTGLNLFLFVPLIRNLYRLEHSICKQMAYFYIRYFTLSNYFIVHNLILFILLIITDIINIFSMIEKYTSGNFKSYYTSFIINILIVLDIKYIPKEEISIVLGFVILNLYFIIREIRPLFLFLSPVLFIYFLPMILLSFNIRSKLIFIPVGFLIFSSSLGLIALFYWVKKNIPTYSPKQKCLESPV